MLESDTAVLAHMGHWLPWIGGIVVVVVLLFVIVRILRRSAA